MISEERRNFHFNITERKNGTSETDHRRYNGFIVHESDVVGREHDKMEIIEHLLSETSMGEEGNVSVTPIIGMGGLGKTTLAQLIYNDDRIKGHFEMRLWVSVTDNFNYTKILKDMMEYHTEMKYDISLLSDLQLESRLLEFLAGKSFLLVLDDVWPERFHWSNLEKLLKHGGGGCRVLVTSRSATVSNVMQALAPYELGKLPEDKCWSLFEKVAFDRNTMLGHNHLELQEIGRKIVSNCDGLPLAIRTVGGLLRGSNDVKKWRRIQKHEIWETEEHNRDSRQPTILPALRLSYNYLPTHLKHCFAFCSLFPKAYAFHKMELVKVWKAASLIRPRNQIPVDEIGIDYFNELLTRSFFQTSEVDNAQTFRMHDLIHELSESVSRPLYYELKDEKQCYFSERVRHVSLICKDVQLPVKDVVEKIVKVRTLLTPSHHTKNFGHTIENIFCTLKCIRILDLSSSTLLELPDSVSNLKLLHYLDLSKTEIRRLPDSVCNLINLQTLKLLHCVWFFELPQNLGNLTNLQHLELDDMFWYKLRSFPPRTGRMTLLQNLHAFPVSQENGCGLHELKEMQYLKGSLHLMKLENAVNAAEAKLQDKEDLMKVVFQWSSRVDCPQDAAADERTFEVLHPHENIKEMEIVHYLGNCFPSWLREGVTKNLYSVSLSHCRNCKVLSLGHLRHLRVLQMKGLLELEEWVDAPYENLRRLIISNCPKLRGLPQNFINLSVMKIKKCNSLKALPLMLSLQFLTLTDNNVLDDFGEKIVQLLINNDQGQLQPVRLHSFINLLEIKVMNCPMLPTLPKYFAPQKLEISCCPLFMTLPTPEFSRRLQHLAINSCTDGTLVKAIPTSDSLYSLVISNISSLTSLPKWPHLPGLKSLYISGCNDLLSLSGEEDQEAFEGLNALELLSIRDCPQLEKLPEKGLPKSLKCLIISSCSGLKSLGPKDQLKGLISLKDLYIEDCSDLQSLPEDGFPTSFQHLYIKGCPKLEENCQKDSGADWPKIMNVPDIELEPFQIPDQNSPKYSPSSAWYHRFICCSYNGAHFDK